MKKQRVILKKFSIGLPGQIILFQFAIPREVENITGVAMGCQWANGLLPSNPLPTEWTLPMQQKRNVSIGELRLQSCEKANIFYTGELALNFNTDMADFTSFGFTPKVYTHQSLTADKEIQVDGNTTVIEGVYKDKFFTQQQGTYRYLITVYLWTELKD